MNTNVVELMVRSGLVDDNTSLGEIKMLNYFSELIIDRVIQICNDRLMTAESLMTGESQTEVLHNNAIRCVVDDVVTEFNY